MSPTFSPVGVGQALGVKKQLELLLLSASDYVCVLDVDLLELVIKTWKGNTEGKLVRVSRGGPEPEQSQRPITVSLAAVSSLLLPGPGLGLWSLPALQCRALFIGPPGKGQAHRACLRLGTPPPEGSCSQSKKRALRVRRRLWGPISSSVKWR